jgi:hypothetical protein
MSWMRADVLPAIAGASRMTRLVERQITVRFATMALAALLIFSFCARSSSQPPAVPEGPSGFYVLELSFANQDRPEI